MSSSTARRAALLSLPSGEPGPPHAHGARPGAPRALSSRPAHPGGHQRRAGGAHASHGRAGRRSARRKARRAAALGLQGASTDLRSAAPPRLGVYDPAIDTAPRATEAAGFEERYGLPPDIDLGKPPEVVFPPAAAPATAEVASPALDPEVAQRLEREAKYPKVTALEVELEHLRQEPGREAYERRLRELARAEDLRRQREERKLVQARYVVEADQRNQATEQRMVADFRAWEEKQYGPRPDEAATETEAGKKPSATASGEEAPPATGTEKSGT